MKMINLALTTEFTFQKCFSPIDSLVESQASAGVCGIADLNNTFGHIQFNKVCKNHKVKPIFGVRLIVVDTIKERFPHQYQVLLLAKNTAGLQEIYRLVDLAYQKFYYFPRIHLFDLNGVGEDILVIGPADLDRIDYEARGPGCLNRSYVNETSLGKADTHLGVSSNPTAYIPSHLYPEPDDLAAYEALSSFKGTDRHTYPGYLLSAEEASRKYGAAAVERTHEVAALCNVELPQARMVQFYGWESIESLCHRGATRRGIDLGEGEYLDRYEYEIALIKDKEYVDYFLIVADLVNMAKRKLLCSPGRGSSGGSLVCYLLGITEVDPLKHGLLFERFLSKSRTDAPDIDLDFPDIFRKDVIKYLIHKYGADQVKHLGIINRFKPRSAIGTVAKAIGFPTSDTEELKDSVIERSSGDKRASLCVRDTIDTTEIGQAFLENYPEIEAAADLEGHASHSGIHAAGILVSNEPITNFAGINSRLVGSNVAGVAMLDGRDAESIGLLKIDCLGLRTLAVLMEVADLAGFDHNKFYTLKLDDPKVFEIFNSGRLSGVFQFDGQALRGVARDLGVQSFNDICAITALARPGTLRSGGAKKFCERKNSGKTIKFFSDKHREITESTYGIMVYQEQVMKVLREIGGLSWEDVITLRKAISKSKGEDYFEPFQEAFVEGAIENGITPTNAGKLWADMISHGSYSFNFSHAVAYSMISYWCAFVKAYFPLEFATACLNHEPDEDKAVKLLREMVTNDGIKYVAIDREESLEKWSIKDGLLIGGLTSIPGIGVSKARKIIASRKDLRLLTPGLEKALLNANTKFKILFPAKHYFGHLYNDPKKYGIKQLDYVKDIDGEGDYTIICKITEKHLKDLNDYNYRIKRDGEVLEKDHVFLNLIVEDDTGEIMSSIGRLDFVKLHGQDILDSKDDWYLARGKVSGSWNGLSVKHIANLKKWKTS